MRFAHLADCHIGAWRESKLKTIGVEAFIRAIDICIQKNVDFILISGDLFHSSMPSIEWLKLVVKKLKELKDNNINVYLIAGSHDFSPSGKTMLEVLENAGLCINVAKGEIINNKLKLKFIIDKKTNAKITGLPGKKGTLEKSYYESLLKEELEKELGYKIFMFHSMIREFKPKDMISEAHSLSLFPTNFNYYAGGHPHFKFCKNIKGYGIIAYPGPLFPTNFRELENLGCGGFYIINEGDVKWEPIQIYNTYSIKIDCNNKTPEQVRSELIEEIKDKEFYNTIVTIRLFGTLNSGRPSDINFKEIFNIIYEKSAYIVLKNSEALTTREFEEIKINANSVEDIETELIREHLGQVRLSEIGEDEKFIKTFMKLLSSERKEDERIADFESRLKSEIYKILGI